MAKRRRKLPNGFGSITELKKRKTKNFWARVTVGTDKNGNPIRKSIGLFDKYNDAYEAIIDYHNKNYNIDLKNITTEKLFEIMINQKEKEYLNPNSKNNGYSTLNRYRSCFKNYYSGLKKKSFKQITQIDIQNIIDNCDKGYHIKTNIKLTYNEMYKVAKEYRVPVYENFSTLLRIGEQPISDKHNPFSIDEIKVLWNNLYIIPDVDLVLITIYTGLRPSELCKLEIRNIFLENKYAIGGIKTKAGIDREIPFCNKIIELIANLYNTDNKYLLPSVINSSKHLSYCALNERFKKVFAQLNLSHFPHDGRHTLETILASLNVNDCIRNAIMGHEQSGIGNKIYNHISIEDKLKAVNLLNDLF